MLSNIVFLTVVLVVISAAVLVCVKFFQMLTHWVELVCETVSKFGNGSYEQEQQSERSDKTVNEVSHSIDHAVRPEQAVNTVSRREPKLADNVIDVEATEVRSSDRKSSQQKKERYVDSTMPGTAEEWAKFESPALRRKLMAAAA